MCRNAKYELSGIVSFVLIYMSSCIFQYFSTQKRSKKRSCFSMVCQVFLLFFRGALLLIFSSQKVEKVLIEHFFSHHHLPSVSLFKKNQSARLNCIATWIILTSYPAQFQIFLELLQYIFFTPVTNTTEVNERRSS